MNQRGQNLTMALTVKGQSHNESAGKLFWNLYPFLEHTSIGSDMCANIINHLNNNLTLSQMWVKRAQICLNCYMSQ